MTLLEALEMEVARTLLGQSAYSNETLSKMIEAQAANKKVLTAKAAELEKQLADQKTMADGISTYYDQFIGWSMEFGLAGVERKRIIIAQLFKRIEMARGYKLRFELDWNYQQFLEGAGTKQSNLIAVLGGAAPPKVKKKDRITASA